MTKENRKHFIGAFLFGSLGLLLLLSLIPTGSHPNLLGQMGAYIAYAFYVLFGLPAWLWVPILFNLAGLSARGEWIDKPLGRFAGLFFGLVSLCSPLYFFMPGAVMREGTGWGGRMGAFFGGLLESTLTIFGATVVCILLFVLAAWLLEREVHLVKAGHLAGKGFFAGLGIVVSGCGVLGVKLKAAWKSWRSNRQAKRAADEARRKIEAESRKMTEMKPRQSNPPPKALPEEAPVSEAYGVDSEEKEEEEEEKTPAPARTIPTVNGQSKPLFSKKTTATEEDLEEAKPKPDRILRSWDLPTVHLFKGTGEGVEAATDDYEAVSRVLTETLANFGVEAGVVGVNPGPTVTQYELQPAAGVKITRISSLADDLALALKCGQLRVVAPIPGKATVGVEVPNAKGRIVTLKEMLVDDAFAGSSKKLLTALGKDIAGTPIYCNLKEMPHLLVAGSTGSGKSVCVNAMIASLIMRATPEEVRFLLVDPKRVELTVFKDLSHLWMPVVNDPKMAGAVLRKLVEEMERRYHALAHFGARDIDTYNDKVAKKREAGDKSVVPMFYIVVLVDELADLMMTARDQIEDSIARLAQMARAVGIHLVLATQRPSVEVLTGIIKANFPSRIAFQVFSKVDSRTVLDMNGAEALLGRGDMLYLPSGAPKPLRLQGCYVSLEDIERLTDFWKSQGPPDYAADLDELTQSERRDTEAYEDELFDEALEIVIQTQQASTSHLQRRLKVGYSRAARLLDEMERRGLVGPAVMNKPRDVHVKTMEDARDTQAFVSNTGGGEDADA